MKPPETYPIGTKTFSNYRILWNSWDVPETTAEFKIAERRVAAHLYNSENHRDVRQVREFVRSALETAGISFEYYHRKGDYLAIHENTFEIRRFLSRRTYLIFENREDMVVAKLLL